LQRVTQQGRDNGQAESSWLVYNDQAKVSSTFSRKKNRIFLNKMMSAQVNATFENNLTTAHLYRLKLTLI